MGIMDLEVQRERRVEILREAESRHVVGGRRSGNKASTLSKFASLLTLVR